MDKYEAQMFALMMSLVLLKKCDKAIKKGKTEKAKKLCEYGKIYSLLCIIN